MVGRGEMRKERMRSMKLGVGRSIMVVGGLALLIIVMATGRGEAGDYLSLFGTEYSVRVINGFTNNSSLPLVIWCSSEEADLGGRALQERDDFSWTMRPNLWSTNLMKCTMKWDRTRKRFDAFRASRDVRRCAPLKMCSWMVTEHGFYFSNDQVNWYKDFEW